MPSVASLPFGSGLRWPIRAHPARRWLNPLLAVLLGACALWAAFQMERRFADLDVSELRVGETPVTLYQSPSDSPRPLAVVAHGFGGSRQMMDQISVTLARSGFVVAAFDFPGHGRHPGEMSRDVTRIEGTTMQLVATTLEVTQAMAARADIAGPVSLVGHSMATDVVIRAAQQLSDVAGIAAISMYSEAITPTEPAQLLIVSGESERRLREAGLTALGQVQVGAVEGATLDEGPVRRRAVVAEGVGHVGVLYHATTLEEVAAWLSEGVGLAATRQVDRSGPISGVLLAVLVLLAWPLSAALPRRVVEAPPPLPLGNFSAALALPVPALVAASWLVPTGLGPQAGFATLAAGLGAWGSVQLLVLARAGRHLSRPDLLGTAAFLFWGLAVFGLALDRYGAAFLPTGPRLAVMALMLLGTVPLLLADGLLVAGASLWRRVAARVVLLLALAGAMVLSPMELGLTFTVLPVLALFFGVYGSFARLVALARGWGAAALGAGLALAWAIAASTPLFSVDALP